MGFGAVQGQRKEPVGRLELPLRRAPLGGPAQGQQAGGFFSCLLVVLVDEGKGFADR
jgi:hypothetical protein